MGQPPSSSPTTLPHGSRVDPPANTGFRPGAGSLWLLVAVFGVEFLLFDQVGARHHTWVYPRWNDQIQYLTEAYTAYEYSLGHGFLRALWLTLTNPSAQGTLHDLWALSVFQITGPSRSAALSVNMLLFLAWQGAMFLAVVRCTGSKAVAWMGTGLTLLVVSPWTMAPGSAIDFRLDWMSTCTVGIALAAAICTNRFLSTGASMIFGAAVALALLTRFLTGTYFLLIFLGFAVWAAAAPDNRGRRLVNLLGAGVIAAVLAGPLFWVSREWVYNYYFIGHFTGPESAIRSPNMGVSQSAAWVWNQFLKHHLGTVFLWSAGTAIALPLLVGPKSREATPAPARLPILPAFAFILFPAIILILHQQKSELVLGVMVPGTVLLGLCLLHICTRKRSPTAVCFWAVALVAVGLAHFAARMYKDPHPPGFEADARRVASVADFIYARAQERGLKTPYVGVDRVTDSLDAQVLRVIVYERKHEWVDFRMTLPTGIMEEKEEVILERAAVSDFLFLTEEGPEGRWPYDRQLRRMGPRLQAWCNDNARLVERFNLFGHRMALYERQPVDPAP